MSMNSRTKNWEVFCVSDVNFAFYTVNILLLTLQFWKVEEMNDNYYT